jgi:hypothetical protein
MLYLNLFLDRVILSEVEGLEMTVFPLQPLKALIPVMSRPMTSVWMSCVPS